MTATHDRLTWNARFSDADMERDFRLARFPFERITSLILIAAVLFQDLATGLFTLTGGPFLVDPRIVVAIWSGMCTCSITAIALVRYCRNSSQLTGILVSYCVLEVILNAALNMLGPSPTVGTAVLFAVSAVLVYVLPLALRWRLPIGVALSLAFILPYAYRDPRNGDRRLEILIGFCSANLIGAVISQRYSSMTRREYAALRHETDMRAALERAASEIQTLRGLLPICSFCKKIRDDRGTWQFFESYIQERSGAKFTHGFCPTCAQQHYGDDLGPEFTPP